MGKVILAVAALVALALPATAVPAELKAAHRNVVTCADGGSFHFVQNQTGTTTAGNTLIAQFTGGNVVQDEDKVTPGGTYHWTVTGTGTLVTATTDVAAGKLVLSDFTCSEKKEDTKK